MASERNFYLGQVDICAKAAEDSMLPNLREKFLRSQAAWQALADRKSEHEATRAISAELALQRAEASAEL